MLKSEKLLLYLKAFSESGWHLLLSWDLLASCSCIVSYQYSGETTHLDDLGKKALTLACGQIVINRNLSNLVRWQTPLRLTVWRRCEWYWLSLKLLLDQKAKSSPFTFSLASPLLWVKSSKLSQSVTLLKPVPSQFLTVDSQGKLSFNGKRGKSFYIRSRRDAH